MEKCCLRFRTRVCICATVYVIENLLLFFAFRLELTFVQQLGLRKQMSLHLFLQLVTFGLISKAPEPTSFQHLVLHLVTFGLLSETLSTRSMDHILDTVHRSVLFELSFSFFMLCSATLESVFSASCSSS